MKSPSSAPSMGYSGQCARRAAARTPFRGARRPGAAGASRDSRRAVTMALGCPRSRAVSRRGGPEAGGSIRAAVSFKCRCSPPPSCPRTFHRCSLSGSGSGSSPRSSPPGPPAARDRGAGGVAPRVLIEPGALTWDARKRSSSRWPRRGATDTASRSTPASSEPRLPGSEIEALAAGRFGSLEDGRGGAPRLRRAPRVRAVLDRAVDVERLRDSACRTRRSSRPSRRRRSPVSSARSRRASARKPTFDLEPAILAAAETAARASRPRRLPRSPGAYLRAVPLAPETSPRSRSSRAASASSPRSFAPRP